MYNSERCYINFARCFINIVKKCTYCYEMTIRDERAGFLRMKSTRERTTSLNLNTLVMLRFCRETILTASGHPALVLRVDDAARAMYVILTPSRASSRLYEADCRSPRQPRAAYNA